MTNVIVTTTINPPTEAIRRFDAHPDFELVVIGDRKTPADYRLARGRYVSLEEQERRYPRLSGLLGWNCIQRRNIGFLIALEMGADIIATIDDDNIPKPGWGENLLIGRSVKMRRYDGDGLVFDPVGATNYPQLWHRGFPLQRVSSRDYSVFAETDETIRIQADFWDGDPDIDAACRMIFRPNCVFDSGVFPFTSKSFAPFNSQNTFIARELVPFYFMFPAIGRMDDIWGSYYLQAATGARPVFCPASVTQERNVHDLTRDFAQEVIGYEKTQVLLQDLTRDARSLFAHIPGVSVAAFQEYHALASRLV